MSFLFDELVYQPIYNVLIFLYNIIPGSDFGIAIVLTTIVLKLVLVPFSKKQIESQRKLQQFHPKIKEIQEKYKNDKEKQTKEVMNFYKENNINPLSGCLPLIIQLIFLIAIYRILLNISLAGLVLDGSELYSFVNNPGKVNNLFIGIVDLSKPSVVIAILAAIFQYFQMKMLMQDNSSLKNKENDGFAEIMSKQMLYLGPVLTLFIGIKFAAGLALYWLVSTLFAIFQQIYIAKKKQA